jgi:hypothetical protein
VMPSFANTSRRWNWTVRGDRNSRVPISGLDRPSAASAGDLGFLHGQFGRGGAQPAARLLVEGFSGCSSASSARHPASVPSPLCSEWSMLNFRPISSPDRLPGPQHSLNKQDFSTKIRVMGSDI